MKIISLRCSMRLSEKRQVRMDAKPPLFYTSSLISTIAVLETRLEKLLARRA